MCLLDQKRASLGKEFCVPLGKWVQGKNFSLLEVDGQPRQQESTVTPLTVTLFTGTPR